MKKITILLFCILYFSGFSQSKTTGVINLTSNMTANFTLNSNTNTVTLVLTGPYERWFGLGLGVVSLFGMSEGDAVLYTKSLTDRNFVGKGEPALDTQDWTTVSNTVASGVRTLTLERALTNSDAKDFQMPYGSTNSIDLAWAHSSVSSNRLTSNHNVGFASANFTTLGVEDFTLNSTTIYPNPSSGEFFIQAKTKLSKVKLYNQLGLLIKTMDVTTDAQPAILKVDGIAAGLYFLELQSDSEKSWKKVIIK